MFIRTADRQQGNTHSPMADPTGGGSSGAQPVSVQPAQPVSAQPDTLQIGGLTVQLVGAGKGRHRQTSGIWKHVVEFTPPTAAGENVKCMVKMTLPAVDTLPERAETCSHLMKYARGLTPARASPAEGRKLSFSSYHLSSTCLCWVWGWVARLGWVARFGGIVHLLWCSPSSLENTEYDNNLQIITAYMVCFSFRVGCWGRVVPC